MAIFKDFSNKMIYGFVALFLLSFTIGAMESKKLTTTETESDFDITKCLISTSDSDSVSDSDINKYLAISDSEFGSESSLPPFLAMSGGGTKPKFDIEIQERELYQDGKKVIFQVRNDQESINHDGFMIKELSILGHSFKQIHGCQELDNEPCIIAMRVDYQKYYSPIKIGDINRYASCYKFKA